MKDIQILRINFSLPEVMIVRHTACAEIVLFLSLTFDD